DKNAAGQRGIIRPATEVVIVVVCGGVGEERTNDKYVRRRATSVTGGGVGEQARDQRAAKDPSAPVCRGIAGDDTIVNPRACYLAPDASAALLGNCVSVRTRASVGQRKPDERGIRGEKRATDSRRRRIGRSGADDRGGRRAVDALNNDGAIHGDSIGR